MEQVKAEAAVPATTGVEMPVKIHRKMKERARREGKRIATVYIEAAQQYLATPVKAVLR